MIGVQRLFAYWGCWLQNMRRWCQHRLHVFWCEGRRIWGWMTNDRVDYLDFFFPGLALRFVSYLSCSSQQQPQWQIQVITRKRLLDNGTSSDCSTEAVWASPVGGLCFARVRSPCEEETVSCWAERKSRCHRLPGLADAVTNLAKLMTNVLPSADFFRRWGPTAN